MSPSVKIGLTGGIGSGKSVVGCIFKALGMPVYDADAAARRLMEQHTGLKASIQAHFGTQYYNSQGQLNRQSLGELVFGSREALNTLNALVHPIVLEDFDQWIKRLEPTKADYYLHEAALVFECKLQRYMDAICVVVAPLEQRMTHLKTREPKRSKIVVQSIMAQQINPQEAQKLAQYTIYNNEEQSLIQQVLTLHKQWSPHQGAQ